MLSRAQRIALGAAAVLYVAAGSLHFLAPDTYLKIMPPYVPWPRQMVYLSGAAEIAGGFGLIVPRVRRAAAWGLVLLLIAVFPANVYMAQNHIQVGEHAIPQVLLWLRLPVQALLIWWVLWSTHTRTALTRALLFR